jgi:hypothetical protein
VGQKGILLRLVEAVDLIYEQYRSSTLTTAAFLCRGDQLPQLRHPAKHRAEGHEISPRLVGKQTSERGLSSARRAPKNHGREAIMDDGFGQGLAWAEQVRLPHDLLEIRWSQTVC